MSQEAKPSPSIGKCPGCQQLVYVDKYGDHMIKNHTTGLYQQADIPILGQAPPIYPQAPPIYPQPPYPQGPQYPNMAPKKNALMRLNDMAKDRLFWYWSLGVLIAGVLLGAGRI